MVTYWNQDPEAKRAFREAIRRKVDKERQAMNARLDSELPAFVAWLAKPLATADFNRTRAAETAQGSAGEETISTTLWFWLGRQFNLFDDVVLEPCPGEFIQLDHLVIAPSGVFIIETKTWSGSVICSRAGCRRRQGKSWVRCDGNPILQNERHVRLFALWAQHTMPALMELPRHVYPVVAFKKVDWLKVDPDCRMPVLEGGLQVVRYLKGMKGEVLAAEQAEQLCLAVKHARPLSATTSG